jgi:hypothetical protein
MRVLLKNGEEKIYTLADVASYEEYRSANDRWDERAFVFRDGSILWEMMAFTSYAPDGSKYMHDGRVFVGGAHHDPTRIMGEYPVGLHEFVEMLKRNYMVADVQGTTRSRWIIRSIKIETAAAFQESTEQCPTQIASS